MTRFASRDLMFSTIPSESALGGPGGQTQECATQCTCCTNKTNKAKPKASDWDLLALERQLAAVL